LTIVLSKPPVYIFSEVIFIQINIKNLST